MPRESPEVYREAELQNPFGAPLLAGPADVYVEGGSMSSGWTDAKIEVTGVKNPAPQGVYQAHRSRDFRYVIPFILQFGLYVSPVGFSSTVVPEKWRLLYSLNPIVGVIDGFRWCVLGGDSQLHAPGFPLSLCVIALFVWLGIAYFRRTEQSFADLI